MESTILDQINELRDDADSVVSNMDDAESAETESDQLANLRCAMDSALRFATAAEALLKANNS